MRGRPEVVRFGWICARRLVVILAASLAGSAAGCGRTLVGEAVCPDGRPATIEVCDGTDNDCDFQVDESDPAAGSTCNTGFPGVCAFGGTVACRSGVLACDLAVEPSPETCNALDDDCDGPVDEEDPGGGLVCLTGLQGVCSDGLTRCDLAAGEIACDQQVTAEPESCNLLDDDCDGLEDEGNPGGGAACATGMPGLCGPGTVECTFGLLLCLPDQMPVAEVCNGLDDDCDGPVDDGNPGGGVACPTGVPGVCATGSTSCVAGAVACLQTVFPGSEACNGLDDDCDGPADEGNPGGGLVCATGLPGVCAPGHTACVAGAIACQSDTPASPEVCNTLDDDCDGAPDDGNPGGGAPCDTGLLGVCAAGTVTCVAGALACVANQLPGAEACNGLDDDCDGTADENDPGGGVACDTGVPGICAAGTTACQNGVLECVQDVPASTEVCNDLDDDCDGTVDDGNPGGGATCDTGLPGPCGPGTITCVDGALVCTSDDPGSAEVCNGADDDCDGTPDDGDPGGGVDCDTGELGVCQDGLTACVAGAIDCERVVDPSPEVCNGDDDDCDGTPDDGSPGTGLVCATGIGGLCDPGHTLCDATGNIVCDPDNAVPESCNGLDDDCDTVIDDNLPLFECGTCDPNCHLLSLTGPFPLPGGPLPVETDGVSLDPMGNLILDSTSIEFHFAWIANYQEGTVSKLDTDTGFEVGRYDSVRLADAPTARPPNESCDWMATGNCPSRTAVDLLGNVWVANRAFGSQGTASKIANLPIDCIDRNGNGIIDTSTDWSGDGTIDPDCNSNGVFDTLATACPGGAEPEFIGQDDECILFTVEVGATDSVPRALSIEAGAGPGDSGDVWVGAFNEGAFYKFDGETGTQLARVPPVGSAGISPYGSVIDSNGILWAVNNCCTNGGIRSINTVTNMLGPLEVKPMSIGAGLCGGGFGGSDPGQYGIAVDGDNRIWLGGWPCNAAFMYDPATDSWTAVDAMNPGFGARGVAVDGFGQVWLAMHLESFTDARLVRIDAATLTGVDTFDLTPLGVDVPVGVGVAFDGSIWTVNQSSSSAVRLHIDPTTGNPTPHPVTGNLLDEFPVGLEPYTYSDFTGFGLRNFTAPQGTYSFVVQGCALGAPATWTGVTWTATTPPGTSVEVSVRAGDTLATIGSETEIGDWTVSPANLTGPPGPVPASAFLQVNVRLLSTDQLDTPTVSNVVVQWNCAPGT